MQNSIPDKDLEAMLKKNCREAVYYFHFRGVIPTNELLVPKDQPCLYFEQVCIQYL